VIAGRRLQMALATDDEARYRPSKYKFWFIVMLQHIPIKTKYIKEWKYNQSHFFFNI
jgi:hypothetical protein